MESLSKFHSSQTLLSLSTDHHGPQFPRPISSISLRRPSSSSSQSPPRLSVVGAASSSSSPQYPANRQIHKTPVLETLKPLVSATCVAVVAAALFLARPALRPAFAEPTAIDAEPDTITDADEVPDEEEEKTLESRLESYPEDVPTLRSLLGIKIRNGKLKEALDIVDRLTAIESGEGAWPLMKAHILVTNGDSETAKSMFESVIAEHPLHVEAFHGLVMAVVRTGGDLDGVLKRIMGVLERCKKEKILDKARDFKLLAAQIKVIEGKFSEALKAYQEIVKEEPRDFRAYLCQGIVYTLMRKKNEADTQFKIYRQLVPKGHPLEDFFDDDFITKEIISQIPVNNSPFRWN